MDGRISSAVLCQRNGLGSLVDGHGACGDCPLRFPGGSASSAPDPLFGHVGEEGLDRVRPRGGRRDNVNMPVRSPREPIADLPRPAGRVPRLLLQCPVHHPGHGIVIDAPRTPGARLRVKRVGTVFGEQDVALPGGPVGRTRRLSGPDVGQNRRKHDLRPTVRKALRPGAFLRRQRDLNRWPHTMSCEKPVPSQPSDPFVRGSSGRSDGVPAGLATTLHGCASLKISQYAC